MKKTFAFILVLAMMLSAVSGAYAQLVSERYVNAPDYYTSEYQAELALTKERAEQYVAQPSMLRSGMAGSLAVPLYKQETTFYCGPASIQMTLKYANGTKYSQSSIATDTGTTESEGTYVYKVAEKLNGVLGRGSYRYVLTSDISISSGVMYSIGQNKPVICNVKTSVLPNYNGAVNTRHYIVIYGYNYNSQSGASLSDLYYNDPHYNSAYYGQYTTTTSNMTQAINNNAGYYIMSA